MIKSLVAPKKNEKQGGQVPVKSFPDKQKK